MGRGLRWVSIVLVAVGAVGCYRTFRKGVVQPNPLKDPLETLRISETVEIVTGDMDLRYPAHSGPAGGAIQANRRYPLRNKARFTIVSRDRLRFHVQLEHKWQEWADVTSWHATLIDDQGRVYDPDQIDFISDRHVVSMWDTESRSVVRNAHGDIQQINNDAYLRRQPLSSLSVFRGRGDFVFYHRDLFTPDIKSLTLTLSRAGQAFVFSWEFAEDEPHQGDGMATAMR